MNAYNTLLSEYNELKDKISYFIKGEFIRLKTTSFASSELTEQYLTSTDNTEQVIRLELNDDGDIVIVALYEDENEFEYILKETEAITLDEQLNFLRILENSK